MDTEKPRFLNRSAVRLGAAFLAFSCAFGAAAAGERAEEPLRHIGVICLEEEPLASEFAVRLAAEGKPVFYISDIVKGISQGDFIRFKDKVVLIDGNVWQTMMGTGVLGRLKNIPVMTLTARAKSSVWDARADQVAGTNENKGYLLGRELLKILEDYFGSAPSDMELVIRFHGDYMTLAAPDQLMNELRFVNVVKQDRKPKGGPQFVTLQPPWRVFVAQPFSWMIWAIDPVEASGTLRYSCSSVLPPSFAWNGKDHTVSGTPAEAGAWPLLFTVRNSRGQEAEFACTLSIVVNTPPRIQARFDKPLCAGSRWEYTPFIADAEHALDELEVRLFEEPTGMTLDDRRKTIVWDVPPDIQDTIIHFIIGARDPLGAVTKEQMSVHVLAPALATQNVTIRFRLPLDTLVQGHRYDWPDHVWMKAEWQERAVRLESVAGDDSMHYFPADSGSGGRLMIRPLRRGTYSIVFNFMLDTVRMVVNKTFTVMPNLPPVFRSRLTTAEYDRNQPAKYTPVVTDDDNDPLTMTIIDEDGWKRTLDEKTIVLPTGKTGDHTIAITAEDPFGNAVTQQIVYTVKLSAYDPARHPYIWYLQKHHRMSADAAFACGGFRVGLYSSDIGKTLHAFADKGFLGFNTVESPFLFVGANPLGERQSAFGNFLFVDWGINFRSYSDRIFGGGALGRVETDYCRNGTSVWRFQGSCILRLKQIFFFIDTSGFGERLKDYLAQGSDSLMDEQINNLNKVFNDYGKADNFGLYLCLQTLFRLPKGFWAGPSAWIEDNIIPLPRPDNPFNPLPVQPGDTAAPERGKFLIEYTGLCLMHEWKYRWLEYSQQLHLGWRSDSWSPKLEWEFVVRAIKKRI